jgi:hypothetical protein
MRYSRQRMSKKIANQYIDVSFIEQFIPPITTVPIVPLISFEDIYQTNMRLWSGNELNNVRPLPPVNINCQHNIQSPGNSNELKKEFYNKYTSPHMKGKKFKNKFVNKYG